MADIEGVTRGSYLTGFARKFNALNTFIDNSFKRAVFVSELSQRVGGRKALIDIAEKGNFSRIATKDIQDSIDEALDFTYQTRFKGAGKTEYGVYNANSAAALFVKAFSTPVVGSGIIPYPRFIASMIKHNFQYAPIVGMLPLERLAYKTAAAGKRLPKAIQSKIKQGKKLTDEEISIKNRQEANLGFSLSKEGRSVNKMIAQQAVGFSLLYGAMQLRAAQGQYAEWYEIQKLPQPTPMGFRQQEIGKGRYADARAFYGVYAPYMLVADLLLKSLGVWDKPTGNNTTSFDPSKLIANEANAAKMKLVAKEAMLDNMNSKFFRDYMEASFGSQFRVGQGLYLLEFMAGKYSTAEFQKEQHREMIADQISTFVANYLVRPVVPINVARDVLGTIDPAWQKIPYRGDVNPMLMGAYGDAARNALGILTRPLPVKEGKLFGAFPIKGYERPAVSPETRRELKAYAGIQKQISGIGGGKFKNRLQKEITRLNINRPWEKFKRYKAPILNRISAKISGKRVEESIINFITMNDEYKKADNDYKKVLLIEELAKVRAEIGEKMESFIMMDEEVKQLTEPQQHQLLAEFYKTEITNSYSSEKRKRAETKMKEMGIDLSKVKGKEAANAFRQAKLLLKEM